jgi:hypothetical protein
LRFEANPGKIVCKTLSQKKPSYKRAGGVAQGIGPEFKHQCPPHTHKRSSKIKIKVLAKLCSDLQDCKSNAVLQAGDPLIWADRRANRSQEGVLYGLLSIAAFNQPASQPVPMVSHRLLSVAVFIQIQTKAVSSQVITSTAQIQLPSYVTSSPWVVT